MKLRTLLLASLLVLAAVPAFAQSDDASVVKATTVVHGDGSRTDTQTDLSTASSEEKTFDSSGKLTRRVVYKLNELGKPVEGTAFTPKGDVLYLFTYTRDSMGRISEERDTTPKGDLIQRFVYHYDSNGHVAGIDAFDAQGNPLKPVNGNPRSKKTPSRRR